MIHSSIARMDVKPRTEDGKYITSDFVGVVKYLIFQELFNIKQLHTAKFGEVLICLDKGGPQGYWRKDVHAGYKASRKTGRDVSLVNFGEIFVEIDELIAQIQNNLPWKVLSVERAEADDIMLVLAEEYSKHENILIHSPDKDMIQAQRGNDTVFQYSSLTKKWLVAESKTESMERWIMEHVCLGDASDEVPKVVDHTEYTDAFILFLKENGHPDITTPMDYTAAGMNDVLFEEFPLYKTNNKGESTGVKDIYKQIRFGPTTLVKKVKEFGTLDKWLDSHPLYRPHYDRNFILVMSEGIPKGMRDDILTNYNESKIIYNDREFIEYLENSGLSNIVMELPSIFKIQRELFADDFGW